MFLESSIIKFQNESVELFVLHFCWLGISKYAEMSIYYQENKNERFQSERDILIDDLFMTYSAIQLSQVVCSSLQIT